MPRRKGNARLITYTKPIKAKPDFTVRVVPRRELRRYDDHLSPGELVCCAEVVTNHR